MQTVNTQAPPNGELHRAYAWGPGEAEMVNAIIGAARHHQMDLRSGFRPKVSRILQRVLFRGERVPK